MPRHPVFRATELMDMAIRIEEHGQAFYEACLSATALSELREVFQYLLSQEIEHARVFSRMKSAMDQDIAFPESYPGEHRNYLDAFVKKEVFDDPETAARQVEAVEDADQAIEWALSLEKQSILFYSGIKSLMKQFEADNVDRIIAQEHDHVRRLQTLRRELAQPKQEP
ncbi:MAG: ferritin family protein [Deltaproteobacteria bacterium]|nr:ferritin family protein [Deltaproteobacteria bacterium]